MKDKQPPRNDDAYLVSGKKFFGVMYWDNEAGTIIRSREGQLAMCSKHDEGDKPEAIFIYYPPPAATYANVPSLDTKVTVISLEGDAMDISRCGFQVPLLKDDE